ncbi:retron Ec48 family effector membrane protein, partial [Yersinia enterocolitica]|nr:retron Ec48 family effector membrane protein [Yersinia enterocolitica]EKN3496917.1 retron Ec48 family effector membrane protein [Yersinia enterocolitica]EKN3693318.1 retron Ec48 family effector membrane protein [Yersinia enterocolitica]EKN3763947.1 retron Ec48 family effector membrane protein [Yersinia enterocolitica]
MIREFKKNNPYTFVFTIVIFVILLLGIILSLSVFIATGFDEKLFSSDLCLTNDCMKNTIYKYSESLSIINGILTLIILLSTLGSIFIALFSYINSVKTSALGNHMAHLKIFQDYINEELKKRDKISPSSIDSLYWYNLIFTNSQEGNVSVSNKYIEKINSSIEISNLKSTNASNGSFRFVEHQHLMINTLCNLGITLHTQPRIQFKEAEDQVIDL